MEFFVFTLTMGRWSYLEKCIKSVAKQRINYGNRVSHYVFLQGIDLPNSMHHLLPMANFVKFETNIGIALGINIAMKYVRNEIIIKMDEDCEILTDNFFHHASAVMKIRPKTILSPYPIGLIGNPGGPKSTDHEVVYDETSDQYYTLRTVNHVGGLCRISPNTTKNWSLESDLNLTGTSGNEDVQFSKLAKLSELRMAYLENAMAVEHIESTLGQHKRHGETYFQGRF